MQPELKSIHRKITNKFLKKVNYPEYLKGSLPKRDYLSNANTHTNSKCILTEDIKNFFPSISKDIVKSVWKNIFHFPDDVSETLSELITYQGFLVQGGVTSSYICNLVLWNKEPSLVEKLKDKEFIYTRYVDDITVSSKRILSEEEKTEIIKDIHVMLKSVGVKLNRKKHKIMPRSSRQSIHRINVNSDRITISKSERDNIKAAVHRCENQYHTSADSLEYQTLFNQVMGKVQRVCQLHPNEGHKLKEKLLNFKPKAKLPKK